MSRLVPFTVEQAIIVTGYTGRLIVSFDLFHKDAERRMGRPIMTHEFGSEAVRQKLEDLYKDDFIAMVPVACRQNSSLTTQAK